MSGGSGRNGRKGLLEVSLEILDGMGDLHAFPEGMDLEFFQHVDV